MNFGALRTPRRCRTFRAHEDPSVAEPRKGTLGGEYRPPRRDTPTT